MISNMLQKLNTKKLSFGSLAILVLLVIFQNFIQVDMVTLLIKFISELLFKNLLVLAILLFLYQIREEFKILISKFISKFYVPVISVNTKIYDIFINSTYIYVIWRMLSRNYAVYAFTETAYLKSQRLYLNFSELPIRPYEIVSLQIIHRFIGLPEYDQIRLLQIFVAILCFIGILIKNNKIISSLVLISCLYFSGFVLMTNAEIEATELLLCALLTIFLLNFYDDKKKINCLIGFNWLVGFYYLPSGLNKLIDIGPSFIWNLNLDERRYIAALDSFDISSRYANEIFRYVQIPSLISDFFGLMTILIELGFLFLFLNNRLAIIPLLSAILLHSSVFLMVGINFTGNSFFLILSCILIYNFQSKKNKKIEFLKYQKLKRFKKS